MLTIITGPSGSGKDYVGHMLQDMKNYRKVVTYTTREPRPGEIDGINYHFISVDKFNILKSQNKFLEIDEYSNNRFYGTGARSIMKAIKSKNNYYIIQTPEGMRNTLAAYPKTSNDIKVVYVTASLGERVKRYIDRVGIDKFDFNDLNEIYARVNRDFGMFKEIEKQADLVLTNNDDLEKYPNKKKDLIEETDNLHPQNQIMTDTNKGDER